MSFSYVCQCFLLFIVLVFKSISSTGFFCKTQTAFHPQAFLFLFGFSLMLFSLFFRHQLKVQLSQNSTKSTTIKASAVFLSKLRGKSTISLTTSSISNLKIVAFNILSLLLLNGIAINFLDFFHTYQEQ